MWWFSGLDVSPQGLQSLGAGQPSSSSSRCRAWAEPGAFYPCLLGSEASRRLYLAHQGSCSHSALTPAPEAVTALHEDGCQMQNPEKIKVQESVKNHLMPGVPLTCLGYCHACFAMPLFAPVHFGQALAVSTPPSGPSSLGHEQACNTSPHPFRGIPLGCLLSPLELLWATPSPTPNLLPPLMSAHRPV